MGRRSRWVKVGLALAVLVVLAAAFSALGPEDEKVAPAPTSTVTRGVVLASVTASGNVTADVELGLDFATGGRLVELAVQEGDRVTPGQVLARVDTREENDRLASARADLASARAELARVREGSTPQELAANRASVARTLRQLDVARTALAGAEASATENGNDYDAAVDQAETAVDQARDRASQNERTYELDIEQAQRDVAAARRAVDDAKDTPDIVDAVTGSRRAAEAQLRAARAREDSARNAQRTGRLNDDQAVEDARAEVVNATNRRASGQQADQQAVRDAAARVGAAQADVDAAQADAGVQQAPPSPAEDAIARAGVARALATVRAAEGDLAEATLVAPTGGTVARIGADIGELVSGSGVGGFGGVDTTGEGEAASSTGSSGAGRGFIVLTDLDSLQVTAGFSEVDAARVRPGQAAALSFEALPGQTVGARVARVDPTSTLVRNVVTYDVTLVLDRRIDGVKPGMTASTQVVVAERSNVPRLPNSAVAGRTDRPTVTLRRGERDVEQPVTVGLRGDDATEIVGGLQVGDRVLTRAGDGADSEAGR